MNDSHDNLAGNLRLLLRGMPIMPLAKFFVLLVCLTLLSIDVFQIWRSYELRLNETNVQAVNLARSLAQHAEDTIKEADTILVGLVERVETDGTGAAHRQRLRGLIEGHVAELPKLHGLFIYDETGRWLVSSNRINVQNANNSDRAYFIFHRNNPDRAPHIGLPVRSRSTGEWIIPISRRLNHADGTFSGVVLATLHVSYFHKFYSTFSTGVNGTIFLANTNGTLLMRHPAVESRIGKDIGETLLFREHLPLASSGSYISDKTAIDGLERMVSYRRLEQYPLVVGVSFSTQEIFQDWRGGAVKHFLITLSMTLFLALLGVVLTRQIGRRLLVENDLRQAQVKLERLNLELMDLAMQDGLTGLANRRRFDIALNEEFNRAMRNNLWLALIMVDVDSFKQYNDSFGHLEGDECLRIIGQTIRSCLNRAEDLPVRYGGEEFAVLLPGADLPGAIAVAERIRLAIRDQNLQHPGSPAGVITVSCGVDAVLPLRNLHIPLDLVHGADKALYKAKSIGRDHVVSSLSQQD